MKGGYAIINLGGIDIPTNGVGVKVPGVYERVEGSPKTLLIEDFSIDGVDVKPCMVNVVVNQAEFSGMLFSVLSTSGITAYFITFADEDIITVESANITIAN